MSLEIYKNNQDQILFGSSGNVFRRPYDFGNAFSNTTDSSYYIKISLPNISQYYSSLCWSLVSGYSGIYHYLTNIKNTNNDNFNHSIRNLTIGSSVDTVAKNAVVISSATTIVPYFQGVYPYVNNLHMVNTNNDNINSITRNSINLTEVTSTTNDYAINEIWIGAVRTSNGTTPNFYSTSETRIHRYILYNRKLSTNEYTFFYNNGSGSDLISLSDLTIDMRLLYAEILDFSSNNYTYDPLYTPIDSDFRVACRDYSGNNHHGEIMNLPAGTLQEQLDYANANLFVPFIS